MPVKYGQYERNFPRFFRKNGNDDRELGNPIPCQWIGIFSRKFSQRATARKRLDRMLAQIDMEDAPQRATWLLDRIVEYRIDPNSPKGKAKLEEVRRLQKVRIGEFKIDF